MSSVVPYLHSCIRGRLLEVNEAILNRPELLLEKVTVCFHQNISGKYLPLALRRNVLFLFVLYGTAFHGGVHRRYTAKI